MHSDTSRAAVPLSFRLASWALIVVCGAFVLRWVFRPDMFFYIDDWSWLHRAIFQGFEGYTVLPHQVYNDRPIGALIITAFYKIFGMNYFPFGVMLVAIHTANGILLSILATRLLRSPFYGTIVGILLVANLNIALPAWWIGTIFDSTSLFFCLCTFIAFLSNRLSARVLCVIFYFLAVRSKEASLPLPFVLLAYSFIENAPSLKPAVLVRAAVAAIKATWPLLLAFVALFGIFVMYYRAVPVSDMGPYAPKFSVSVVIDGIKIYLRYIWLDLPGLNAALIIYLVLTAIALATWTRLAVFASIAFIIAASPVLVLGSQRVPYYGYIPSPYISLLIVALLQRADGFLASRWTAWSGYGVKAAAAAATVWFVAYAGLNGLYRDSLIATMSENSRAMRTLLAAVGHIDEGTKIVITGLPPGATHLFFHAPCHAINVAYKVRSIDCRIDGSEAALTATYAALPAPKLLLHYDGGTVSVVNRSP